MKVLFYSTKDFELPYLRPGAAGYEKIQFIAASLDAHTAALAEGFDAISIFTADEASEEVLTLLYQKGVRMIALRSTGYDNVDIAAAGRLGLKVANVPEYSPNAIAEHTVALILALNRKLVRADSQVRQQNFSLDKLVGSDLNKKKIGIIGTGHIGRTVARIMHGFGCTIFAHDDNRDPELESRYKVIYTGLQALCSMCDIISLHLPLTERTRYLVKQKLVEQMKPGVMLINTSRGAIVNTKDVLQGLSSGQIGYYGADVYEYEKGLFFYDHSGDPKEDKLLQALLKHSNVLITPHQGFATHEALAAIAGTSFANLEAFRKGEPIPNELTHAGSLGLPAGERVLSRI